MGTTLLQGQAKDRVYEWPVFPSQSSPIVAFACTKSSSLSGILDYDIRHHLSISLVLNRRSLPISTSTVTLVSSNKSHKLPFSNSSLVSHSPLEIIFSNVWTSPIYSVDGFKYYVIFVDHFSKYIWFYPLKQKSNVCDIFVRFKGLVENYFKAKIVTLYSDQGGEYQALESFLALHGISHFTTPPHTLEHNGYSKRRHRHIMETHLSLLYML